MLYHVTVEFNRDFITVDGDQMTIGVKSRPVGGAANMEIIKKIAKHLGVPSSSVVIKSGHRTSRKIVQTP